MPVNRGRPRGSRSGAGGGPPPFVVDWGAAALPPGVTYARTGAIWTVDDAAQSHLTSYAANAWATETWSDGVAELCVNPAYTNLVTVPRDISGALWNAGIATATNATYAAGPDGVAATAGRTTAASAQYSNYRGPLGGGALTRAASLWLRHATASGTYQFSWGQNVSIGTGVVARGTATTTWRKLALVSGDSAPVYVPFDGRDLSAAPGGGAATAGDVVTDLHQIVAGLYSPPFTSTSAGATIVSVAGASLVSPAGHFDVDFATLRPYESAAARATDGYLLYLGANDHLRFRASDNTLVLTLNSAAVLATAALAYAADAAVAVRAWARADGCGITVDGVTVTAATAAASAVPATAYLLSDGSSAGVFSTRARGRLVARRAA